jgi:hypothetical protein
VTTEEDPIRRGYAAGVQRAQDEGLLAFVDRRAEETVQTALSLTVPLLRERDASRRAAALFSELVTVAALARFVNDEPPLTEADVAEYLYSTGRFTRCWFGWFCRDEDR